MIVTLVLNNAQVFRSGVFSRNDVSVSLGGGVSRAVSPVCVDASSFVVLPGFVDVHVHLREPGFSYKETIRSGSLAAAHGGYTTVCAMPNLNPVPDSMEHLQPELDAIRRDAVIRVLPYGAITEGEKGEKLADLDAMAPYVVAFSDDGKGVQDREMMRVAMLKAKQLGRLIVAHCEDNSLLHGGYIHDGAYARTHGHRGICSESEWRPIQRDLELVRETGCGYHVCHISTKESVDLIRKAKAEGLDVTCETGPHYLLLDDSCLQEDGCFKMNPPLRDKADREALLEGLADGTIDMIATDHAPHSAEEKGRGLEKSAMGIVGLETAFPLLYTELVEPGVISMERLMELLHDAPCRRFNIPTDTGFTVFDLNDTYRIDPADFLSMGKATPFTGWEVQGRCLLTAAGETAVWYDADRLLKGE
ncbi:dihydroorotase [Dysosmobacter sp.]|uniref:dihydroorotase n=1 Tax=Dysosmobacter sp. TaxID=2591382 RepID=UPI003AEFC89C